jgi:hypothetical protein
VPVAKDELDAVDREPWAADEDWVVVVDWTDPPDADRLLAAWLSEHGVDRQLIDPDLRCDISRSTSGRQDYRYSVRRRWT